MSDNNKKIDQLLYKVQLLSKRQEEFSKEINNLQKEIEKLKFGEINKKDKIEISELKSDYIIDNQSISDNNIEYSQISDNDSIQEKSKAKTNLEKFIGENLISKIGIIITIIGIAIGIKYSLDHNLLTPLTRIISGYLVGLLFLGIGIKLKKKYTNFSAVLVSGAMAIMYFITYASYGIYNIMPQITAFILMLIFTVFTVTAAIKYNRQVIAHIGLVGAYAVPLLLNEGSGNIAIFLSYITIINIGILVISFRKYWKPLYYISFSLTWIIYLIWYLTRYNESNFSLAITFLIIFFVIFYLTSLAYKLIQNEKFRLSDIILILANSFISYGIGFMLINNHFQENKYLGIFTICYAITHLIVCILIYIQKHQDKNLFYFISGLFLIFVAIAIPVQLNGNWITLLWAGEAALVFWIGKTKNVSFYEKLSYILIILTFSSLLIDWKIAYYSPLKGKINPIININFLTSVLVILTFGFINYINYRKKDSLTSNTISNTHPIISFLIPTVLIFTIYSTFLVEIKNYWDQLYIDSMNKDPLRYKWIWYINYTLFFVSAISFINTMKLKSQKLGKVFFTLSIISILSFLTLGLYEFSELRDSYLNGHNIGIFNILIRYISFIFIIICLFTCHKYVKQSDNGKNKIAFDFLLHTTILWIASSELLNFMNILNLTQNYKLSLSILWGIYSLFLIILGIWKKKKYLRISAIVLFAITLAKLFLYDISHLNTISKTIIFVSLGLLLLLISFLYNKYKHKIFEE